MTHDRKPSTGRPRWFALVAIVLAVALLVLMIVLHLSGAVGPGTHG